MTLTDLIPEIVKLDRSDMIRVIRVIASELAKDPDPIASESTDQQTSMENNSHSLDDTADRALAFYNSELAFQLEPEHNGEDVAIHVDTKSYEVARGVGHAYRAMRAKFPEGPIIVHRIGIADQRLDDFRR
jgi:hypothetical protein